MLAIWSLVPLPFLTPVCTSESSRFTYCWSLAWRILSIFFLASAMLCLVTQSCLTLCDIMDYSPPDSSRQEYWSGLWCPPPGDLPTQGSNPCLPHCKWILYQLSHEGREMSAICTVVWTFFGIAFLWDWNGIFQSCGPRILWAKGDSLPKWNKVWLHHILLHYSEWTHNLKFMKCVFLQFAI